ncbi:YfaP family protein [Viridibacterium curvum]
MTPHRSAHTLILATIGMLTTIPVHSAGITLESPAGGWRNSSKENSSFMQDVTYPAVRVNVRNTQQAGSLIRGRIAKTPKDGKPLTLVINGSAMPQRVDADGSFARPYAFPAGSNSIEVRGNNGERQRTQYYEAYSGRSRPHVRVTLSWDSDGSDLDLHLVTPAGEHIYFGNRQATDGTALDVDVTTGYGPEIIASPSQMRGTYLVYVNYYGAGGDRDDELTTAQVAIVTDEGTPREKQQLFRVPLRKPGELTLIRAFQYP